MQITSININSTNKTSIYSNFSNSINFKGNKKSEKIDAETSKPSFLMQMGQRKAKKLELALPVIQKKADYSTKCIKGLNFPIDGKFEGHPDNTYRRAIAILSNDLMHEITDRGTPLWKVQRILEDEVCCGEDGKSNLEEKRDFLYEHLSDNETFETYRLFSDCDNPHTMTATFAKDGITIEKKSLSGDIENLEYSPEGRLLHYKRKDAREMFLGKPVFVMEYAYDEEADTAIYVQRGNRYNDSSQHIFKDGELVMLKRLPASSADWNDISKPAKIAFEFKNGKVKNIYENFSEQDGERNFSAKYTVNKDGKLECVYNTTVFNSSAKIRINGKTY